MQMRHERKKNTHTRWIYPCLLFSFHLSLCLLFWWVISWSPFFLWLKFKVIVKLCELFRTARHQTPFLKERSVLINLVHLHSTFLLWSYLVSLSLVTKFKVFMDSHIPLILRENKIFKRILLVVESPMVSLLFWHVISSSPFQWWFKFMLTIR